MPDTTDTDPVTRTSQAWARHATIGDAGWTATPGTFTAHTSPDGQPILEAQVTGPHALEALHAFGAHGWMFLGENHQAALDYGEVGQVGIVWRDGPVWVRLWVTDTGTVPDTLVVRYGPAKAFARRNPPAEAGAAA